MSQIKVIAKATGACIFVDRAIYDANPNLFEVVEKIETESPETENRAILKTKKK